MASTKTNKRCGFKVKRESENCSLFTQGRKSSLFQLFRRRQQKRRQAAVVLTAAVNAAVSRSLSDNWWELVVGAGDLRWMLWRFYPLAATFLPAQKNTVLLAFTLANILLTTYHNAQCYTNTRSIHFLMQCMLLFCALCISLIQMQMNDECQ